MKLTREQKAEKYRALPVAMVIKPLKHLASKLNSFDPETKETILSPVYVVAKRLAGRGDGAAVQRIALKMYANQGV